LLSSLIGCELRNTINGACGHWIGHHNPGAIRSALLAPLGYVYRPCESQHTFVRPRRLLLPWSRGTHELARHVGIPLQKTGPESGYRPRDMMQHSREFERSSDRTISCFSVI
jgi:hypothetical protein